MKKIISVVGARPNFIKLAALNSGLSKNFIHIIVHTGQHYDYLMSQNFFDELILPKPNYNLAIGSKNNEKQVKKIIEGCTKIFEKEKPDLVLIYGDTNSSVGGALAASISKFPIAHIEAGVRSFDSSMPEEVNRKTIDKISSILFCPSKISVKNLRSEGIRKNVYFVGDTMYEVLLKTKPNSQILSKIGITPKNYYYATIHRQKNTNNIKKLESLLNSLSSLEQKVIFPIHPRTKNAVSKLNKKSYKNINFIDPVDFKGSITLQKNSLMTLTDSGGVQKESYYLKVPCLTLRDSTEWPETVKSGWNKLVDNNEKKIIKYSNKFFTPRTHPDYYGEGNSSQKIIKVLQKFYYD